MASRHLRRALQILGMAKLSEFDGVEIWMWPEKGGKHNEKHFRAEYGEYSAIYAIPSLEVLAGEMKSNKEKIIREWAIDHMNELVQDWDLVYAGQKPASIEPYRRKGRPKQGRASIRLSPKVVDFELAGPGTMRIAFDDGVEKVIDFRPIMFGELFGPLRDPDLFRSACIKSGFLAWPNGAGFDNNDLHDWDAETEQVFAVRFIDGERVGREGVLGRARKTRVARSPRS